MSVHPELALGYTPIIIILVKNMLSETTKMDEYTIQEVKTISRDIVRNEFPEEEEYFDFLFDLTMQEIEELEPDDETEFLKKIR